MSTTAIGQLTVGPPSRSRSTRRVTPAAFLNVSTSNGGLGRRSSVGTSLQSSPCTSVASGPRRESGRTRHHARRSDHRRETAPLSSSHAAKAKGGAEPNSNDAGRFETFRTKQMRDVSRIAREDRVALSSHDGNVTVDHVASPRCAEQFPGGSSGAIIERGDVNALDHHRNVGRPSTIAPDLRHHRPARSNRQPFLLRHSKHGEDPAIVAVDEDEGTGIKNQRHGYATRCLRLFRRLKAPKASSSSALVNAPCVLVDGVCVVEDFVSQAICRRFCKPLGDARPSLDRGCSYRCPDSLIHAECDLVGWHVTPWCIRASARDRLFTSGGYGSPEKRSSVVASLRS